MADPPALVPLARMLLTAGRLLLESGAETSRVEETMHRMGRACGAERVAVFSTPTGIFLSLTHGEEVVTELVTVERRSIDLARVAAVNDISRRLERGDLTPAEADDAIRAVPQQEQGYPFSVRLLARGLSCAAWAVLLGGTLPDFLPAMIAGFIVHVVHHGLQKRLPDFLALFFGAAVGTEWALIAVNLGLGEHVSSVVVGVILPLVPGMALTGAIRDLIAGDLLSGVARGAEALLVAAAIAGGVWAVLATQGWMFWL